MVSRLAGHLHKSLKKWRRILMTINPSEKKFFEMLAVLQQSSPAKPLSELTLEEWRCNTEAFFNNSDFTGEAANIPFQDSSIVVRDGYRVPIRIYNSDIKEIKSVLIFYPGCAYILDSFEVNAIAASRIAYHAGIKVIIVNHRLGPEHLMPGSTQDSYDVTKYIATHAKEFGVAPKKIFVGGISSGGHCAAAISNLARKDKSFSIHHQILLNMWLVDPAMRLKEFLPYEQEDKMANREALDFFIVQHKLTEQDLHNPLINPSLEKDLSGLPNATILVAEYDGIRSDSEIYHQCLVKAGNNVEKIVLPGQTHNTLILRKAMCDGRDPAEVVAEVIRKNS